jgi:hypothetical protein
MPRSIGGCVGLFAALVGFGACSVNQSGLGGGGGGAPGAAGVGAAGTGTAGGGAAGTGVAGQGTAGSGAAGSGTAGTGAAGTGAAGTGAAGTGAAGTGAAGTGAAGTGAAGTGTAASGGAGTGAAGTAGTGAAGAGAAGAGGNAGAAGASAGGVSGSSGGGHGDTCNASSCPNGCCQNGQCVTNRTNQVCGNGGGACAPCGACLRCGSAGACEPDPSSSWKVTCVSATVSATKPNGQVWDPAYSSPPQSNADPFCRLDTRDGRSRSSPIVMDTLTPVWNADVTPTSGGGLTASLLLGQGQWTITVLDDDPAVPTTETICTVTPQLSATTLGSGMLDFSNVGSCVDLTLTVACAK